MASLKNYKNDILKIITHSDSTHTADVCYQRKTTSERLHSTYFEDYADEDYESNVFGATMGVKALQKDIRDVFLRSIQGK